MTDNLRALGLCLRSGFQIEGLRRQAETDACNFQHPPEAEARFFMASDVVRFSPGP